MRETIPIQPGNWETLNEYLAEIEPRVFNVTTYRATPGGVVDCTAAFTAAVTAASAAGGGVVWIPPGTWRIATQVSPRSNVTIMGAGRDATTLVLDDAAGSGISNGGVVGGFTTTTTLASNSTVDSDTVAVTSATGFAVGDLVMLDDAYGNGTTQENHPQLITGIRSIAGSNVTLDEPLPMQLLTASAARMRKLVPVTNARVCDLTITVAGSGTSRDNGISMTHTRGFRAERLRITNLNKASAFGIALGLSVGASVNNCEFENVDGAFGGVNMSHSEFVHNKIRDSMAVGAKFAWSSWCTLDNNDVICAHDSVNTGRGLKHEFGCVHCTINGNRVVGSGIAGIYLVGVQHCQANNNKVYRAYNVQSSGGFGIGVAVGTGSDWASVHHIEIVGNTIEGIIGTASFSGNGIYVDSLTQGQVSIVGNHISCVSPLAQTSGIRADGPRLTIVGNTINGWGAGANTAGIYLHSSATKCLVAQNLLYNGGTSTGKAIDTSLSAGSNKVFGNMTLDEALSLHTSDTTESQELAYNEFTAPVSITATNDSGANTVATASAVTFDGATRVFVEFFSSVVTPGANLRIIFVLYDGGTWLDRIGDFAESAAGDTVPVHLRRRITPSAGAHTYSVRAFVNAGTGTVGAGAGGAGVATPGFIRIVRA